MRKTFTRRSFVFCLGTAAFALPPAGGTSLIAQQRLKRVGFLNGNYPTLIAAFEEELARRGYSNGKNVVIEKRFPQVNTESPAVYVAEIAAMDLDLVVVGALPLALMMRKANPNMPMVIATCPGMVSNGFAKTLKRPGGIYTGMDELPAGVTATRLGLLKNAAPDLKRIALLSTTPGVGGHEMQVADAETAARSLKLTVKPYRAASRAELETALASITDDGMDGLLNFQGGLSLTYRDLIVDFAVKHKLPAIYQSRFFVDAGGLMSWAPDQEEQFRMAARNVAKILDGVKPGNLPVHFPERYYLAINKNAAKQIGLDLPASIVKKADHVMN